MTYIVRKWKGNIRAILGGFHGAIDHAILGRVVGAILGGFHGAIDHAILGGFGGAILGEVYRHILGGLSVRFWAGLAVRLTMRFWGGFGGAGWHGD